MKIKIATIMAVYHGDYPAALVTALQSVQQQVFSYDIESRIYLAVDGPVSPAINSVLAEHEQYVYRICRLEHNGGLAAALNVLIKELCDEDFVFRMDADDRSYPNRYQSQLNYFKQHPDIDILGTDIIELNTESGTRRRVSFCRSPDDALARLCRGVPVAHPTVCFRRHVLYRVGGYPQAGSNEDIALWFRCAKEGFKFSNVHEPLLEFTVGPNFWRRRSVDKAYGELRIYIKGIWGLHGVTFKYIYPLLRFVLRLAPHWLSRIIYKSPLRRSTEVS